MTIPARLSRTLALAGLLAAAALTAACGSDAGGGAAATAAGGGGSSPAAVKGGGGTLRIALIGTTGPIPAAKNDGSLVKDLAKVGAKVQFTGQFPAFAPAAEAINAGAVDAANGSISAGIGALSQHPSFSIYAAQQADDQSEGILVKDDKIRTVADLAGKKVAVNPSGTGEYLLLKALDKYGVPADKVKRVYLPAPDGASAFSAGKVDGWAAWGDFVASAKAKGARLVADGAQVGSENDTIWVIAKQFLAEHPATVKALFDNLRAHSIAEHDDPEGSIAKENTGVVKLDDKAAAILADSYRALQPVGPVTPAVQERFGHVAQFFLDQGVIEHPLDIASFTVDAPTLGAGS
jgi:sulfonate transport system substrate-binding protein